MNKSEKNIITDMGAIYVSHSYCWTVSDFPFFFVDLRSKLPCLEDYYEDAFLQAFYSDCIDNGHNCSLKDFHTSIQFLWERLGYELKPFKHLSNFNTLENSHY